MILAQVIDWIDAVVKIASEPIKLPDDKVCPMSQGFQAGRKPGQVD